MQIWHQPCIRNRVLLFVEVSDFNGLCPYDSRQFACNRDMLHEYQFKHFLSFRRTVCILSIQSILLDNVRAGIG